MRVLSYEQTLKLLDWDGLISAIRSAYGPAFNPAMDPGRLVVRGTGSVLRAMAAASPSGRYMGAKLFAASSSTPRVRQLAIALFNQKTGLLEALMDGRAITLYRTAATSAVAIDLLSRRRAVRLAVLGSGHEARSHVAATRRVRRIEALRVYSPTKDNRERFAADFSRELGIQCDAVASAQEAVDGADLILAAARSRDETPIIAAEWCSPDATIVSIGSTLPEQRELGPDTLCRAALMVCDLVGEVLEESGDLIAAAAAGVDMRLKAISISEMVARHDRGDALPQGILLFKSVGSGLQDVVAAEITLDRAITQNIGTEVQIDIGVTIRS